MLLNFIPQIIPLLYVFTYFFIYMFLLGKVNDCLTSSDIYLRLDLNLFSLDLIQFSWTHINYLFVLLPLLLFLPLHSTLLSGLRPAIMLVFIFILLIDGYILSWHGISSSSLDFATAKMLLYNPLLANALNRYHPYLLYFSWLYVPALLALYLHNKKKFDTIYRGLKKLALSIIIIVSLTLFLGSWWAYQEGSWGGWWNWDPSEVFGLLIALLILMSSHKMLFRGFTRTLLHYMLFVLGVVLAYYSFMQVNFTLISHNFGFRDNDLLDIKNFYLILITTLFAYTTRWLVSISLRYSFLFCHTNFKNYKLSLVILSYVGVITLSAPLFTLLNDFLWRLFNINASNNVVSYHILSIVLATLYMFMYNSQLPVTAFIMLQFVWGTGSQFLLWLSLSIPFILRNKFYYAHYIFIFVIVYNIELCGYLISLWSSSPVSFDVCNAAAFLYDKTCACIDYPYSHLVHLSDYANDVSSIGLYFTVPDTKNFSLLQSSFYTLQALTSDHNSLRYSLVNYEYSLSFMPSLILIFFIISALIMPNFIIVL